MSSLLQSTGSSPYVLVQIVGPLAATMSPNEMHEVSSDSTRKSIPVVEEETAPGQIRNNEVDVENNMSKAYAAEVGNDDITILPNDMSCS